VYQVSRVSVRFINFFGLLTLPNAICSGIQHLAALLSDFNLGLNVNLVPSENIADIYTSLLEPINNNINKFGQENIEFNNLSEIKLTRKNIKLPIMTKV
jgi:DNA-directed RNA polymerase